MAEAVGSWELGEKCDRETPPHLLCLYPLEMLRVIGSPGQCQG